MGRHRRRSAELLGESDEDPPQARECSKADTRLYNALLRPRAARRVDGVIVKTSVPTLELTPEMIVPGAVDGGIPTVDVPTQTLPTLTEPVPIVVELHWEPFPFEEERRRRCNVESPRGDIEVRLKLFLTGGGGRSSPTPAGHFNCLMTIDEHNI